MAEQYFVKGQLNQMIFQNQQTQFSIASISVADTDLELDEEE